MFQTLAAINCAFSWCYLYFWCSKATFWVASSSTFSSCSHPCRKHTAVSTCILKDWTSLSLQASLWTVLTSGVFAVCTVMMHLMNYMASAQKPKDLPCLPSSSQGKFQLRFKVGNIYQSWPAHSEEHSTLLGCFSEMFTSISSTVASESTRQGFQHWWKVRFIPTLTSWFSKTENKSLSLDTQLKEGYP